MKIFDFIFALVVGAFVAWLAGDFLILYNWAFFILLPILSVILLDLIDRLFAKIFIVRQIARFVLVGGFADIIDIKAYWLIFLFFPASLAVKSISFLIAVAIKYAGNKYWVFDKNKEHSIKEAGQFLFVTLVGLGLNLGSFYLATHFGPQTKIWTEVSIIIAALVASVWNFLGYKLLVFKK